MKRFLIAFCALAALSGHAHAGRPARAEQAPDQASRIDPDALAAYRAAAGALLERERTGVRARVALAYPDGSVGEGVDEYISGPQLRLRERRPDYEVVAVGDTLCRQPASEPLACLKADGTYLGIRELVEGAIQSATSSSVACGSSMCRRIDIGQRRQSKDPAKVKRYAFALLIREDGLPYSFTESAWSGSTLVQPLSTFVFDYETRVASIELPAEAAALLAQATEQAQKPAKARRPPRSRGRFIPF